MTRHALDYEALADVLEALGSANRLRLLHALVTPQSLSEMRLPPEAVGERENADRAISRQAVRDHTRRLIAVGLLRFVPGESHGGWRGARYSLDSQRLFAIVEEVRQLGRLRSAEEDGSFETKALPKGAPPASDAEASAHLLVVHGATEGVRFPLDGAPGSSWVVGRRRDACVPVTWDPYVSGTHLVIASAPSGEFSATCVPGSLNGASLNFAPMRRDGPFPISHGDVLGVGKTLLLFRER